ncbi:MAG: MBL fold metallo-hydrolase [Pseudomonadota bacterium]
MFYCTVLSTDVATKTASDHVLNGKFVNPDPKSRYKIGISNIFSGLWKYITEKSEDSKPKDKNVIPVIKQSIESLLELEDYSVIRLLHSTLLFKIEGKFWLTDPVFSDNISPTNILSSKRFHVLPINIENLPEVEGVVISHNHYDHLDEDSIKSLRNKTKKFFVPLGLSDTLIQFGINKENIVELDWWESARHESIELVATPAQHFSGRGLFDGGKTLWCSWVINSPKAKIYFSGDSGYFKGFKEIGQKYGPFDMTFLEAGAYHEDWKEMHMMPVESVQSHIDLRGNIMFPIHNSSFDLAMHSWHEPFGIIFSIANRMHVDATFPKMGEAVSVFGHIKTEKWWKMKRANE